MGVIISNYTCTLQRCTFEYVRCNVSCVILITLLFNVARNINGTGFRAMLSFRFKLIGILSMGEQSLK